MLTALMAGCVGPARWFGAYEGKAVATADQMASAVETARLTAEVAATSNGLGPYLSVALADAEEDATSIRDAFDSIQPPDDRADGLRDQFDGLLSHAASTLSEMRIAARRGDFGRIEALAGPLQALSQQLHAFADAHR
jgi:hypothetical protein